MVFLSRPNLLLLRRLSKAVEGTTGRSQDVLGYYRSKYALPNGFIFRPATKADYAQVLKCVGTEVRGLDFLPAYFNLYFQQPNRRNVVIVNQAKDEVAFFGSVIVVDDGQTGIGTAARVRKEYRGQSLFQFGLSLFHEVANQFPSVKQVIAVTRDDQAILEPRYAVGGLQKNKLIGTNNYVNLTIRLSDLEKVAKNIADGGLSVARIPYSETSELVGNAAKVRKLMLGGDYVVIDSVPYQIGNQANFKQPNVYNTQVFVGSAKEQPDKPSSIDSVSFVTMNPALAGIHARIYLYSASVNAALDLLRSSIIGSLTEFQKISKMPGISEYTQNYDVVQLSVMFPVLLNQYEMRKRLFEVGFQPGLSGTDIQRQYLYHDEALSALWRAGAKENRSPS